MPETMVTMICRHCRGEFAARAVVVRTRGRPYCSPECSQRGRTRPLADRLDDLSVYEPNSGCRLYLGVLDRHGYGLMTNAGRTEMAHRAAYRSAGGLLDASLEIDHLCRNRGCINPAHLEPVPHRENSLRGLSPMAVVVRTGVCLNGHARDGDRPCRTCAADYARRYRRRQRERT